MSDAVWREDILRATGVFNDGKIDLLSMLRGVNSNIPGYIYRYRSGSYNDLHALENGYEWLAYPDDYNDPFDARMFYDPEEVFTSLLNRKFNNYLDTESRVQYNYLTGESGLDEKGERGDQQLLNKAKLKHGLNFKSVERHCSQMVRLWKELAIELYDVAESSLREKASICSFTTKPHNYLMWAHYADSHKGFCLEYNRPEFTFDSGFMLPVVYRENPIEVTKLLGKGVRGESDCATSSVMASAIVKSSVWEYEDEWRFICYQGREGRRLKELDLNRVILGCNASEELTNNVLERCRKRGVEVVKQQRSPHSFNLIDGEVLLSS